MGFSTQKTQENSKKPGNNETWELMSHFVKTSLLSTLWKPMKTYRNLLCNRGKTIRKCCEICSLKIWNIWHRVVENWWKRDIRNGLAWKKVLSSFDRAWTEINSSTKSRDHWLVSLKHIFAFRTIIWVCTVEVENWCPFLFFHLVKIIQKIGEWLPAVAIVELLRISISTLYMSKECTFNLEKWVSSSPDRKNKGIRHTAIRINA